MFVIILIYLVDPASSHIFILKSKPCMSKFFDLYTIDCEWLIITIIINMNYFYFVDNFGNSLDNT